MIYVAKQDTLALPGLDYGGGRHRVRSNNYTARSSEGFNPTHITGGQDLMNGDVNDLKMYNYYNKNVSGIMLQMPSVVNGYIGSAATANPLNGLYSHSWHQYDASDSLFQTDQ